MLEGPLMADISGWVGAQPYGAQLQQFREMLEQKGETIIQAFNDRCEKAGITPETWMKMGHPPQIILEEEARTELVILGQKGEHAEWIGDMIGSLVERVIRRSVKPCLVTPGKFQPVKGILAAYDGSNHSSQALHEAIELADALKVKLHILTVLDGLDRERAEEISRDGISLTQAHHIEAEGAIAEGKAEEVILERAGKLDCNLIVVGAYGHSRIREMILGSTTTYLVAYSDVPIMLVR
jgi:nucleotide-binding universal stress UspA family protein